MAISTKYEPSEEMPNPGNSRRCEANLCPLPACVSGRCQFHAFTSGWLSEKVTATLLQKYTMPPLEGDQDEITIAEASYRNRVIQAIGIDSERYETKQQEFIYPQAVARREYQELADAGLIPQSILEQINGSVGLLLNALRMRYGFVIRFETGEAFCLEWLCRTYEEFLLQKVKRSVKDFGQKSYEDTPELEDVMAKRRSERVQDLQEISTYLRRAV